MQPSQLPVCQVSGKKESSLTLILGDDNFTFSPCYVESEHIRPNEVVEVSSCLPEEKIPDEFRPNYLALIAQGVVLHFGINPAQLRNHFFSNQYSKIIFVLPGIAFAGFPPFIDKHDPLFRLRLHIYAFSFLKSSKNALTPDAVIQFVWPRQNDKGELPSATPWQSIDIAKVGPFCEIHRSETEDEVLNLEAFRDWRPLIHNEPAITFPAYLSNVMLYSWRLTRPPDSVEKFTNMLEAKCSSGLGDDKDANLLFVPPSLWEHPAEVLPHVNELFKFEMRTNDNVFVVVSKPTLKFDPRFRSDGGLAKNPFSKRAAAPIRGRRNKIGESAVSRGVNCPPPPPPPDSPLDTTTLPSTAGNLSFVHQRHGGDHASNMLHSQGGVVMDPQYWYGAMGTAMNSSSHEGISSKANFTADTQAESFRIIEKYDWGVDWRNPASNAHHERLMMETDRLKEIGLPLAMADTPLQSYSNKEIFNFIHESRTTVTETTPDGDSVQPGFGGTQRARSISFSISSDEFLNALKYKWFRDDILQLPERFPNAVQKHANSEADPNTSVSQTEEVSNDKATEPLTSQESPQSTLDQPLPNSARRSKPSRMAEPTENCPVYATHQKSVTNKNSAKIRTDRKREDRAGGSRRI